MMSDLIFDYFHVMFSSPRRITTGFGGSMGTRWVFGFGLRILVNYGRFLFIGLKLSGMGLLRLGYDGKGRNSIGGTI